MRLGYLDTSKADISRLREARKHINFFATFFVVFFIFFYLLGIFSYYYGFHMFFLYCFFQTIISLVLFVGLIIKREIYGVMVFLKDNLEI